MALHQQKRTIRNIATRMGYTVARIDLRSCIMHLQKGKAIWLIPFPRGATEHQLGKRMQDGVIYGKRLDRDPTSSYFVR